MSADGSISCFLSTSAFVITDCGQVRKARRNKFVRVMTAYYKALWITGRLHDAGHYIQNKSFWSRVSKNRIGKTILRKKTTSSKTSSSDEILSTALEPSLLNLKRSLPQIGRTKHERKVQSDDTSRKNATQTQAW